MKNKKLIFLLGLGVILIGTGVWISNIILSNFSSDIKKTTLPQSIASSSQMPEDSLYAPQEIFLETSEKYRFIPVSATQVDVNKITNTAILNNVFGNTPWTKARPIYIERLPDDFAQYGDYYLYVQSIMPLILRENNKILSDRNMLIELITKQNENVAWTPQEQIDFQELLKKYDVKSPQALDAQIAELLERVDVIPPSLAMAQSAVQTNWGRQNMLSAFGQKTWVDGRYDFKKFDSLSDAVHSYVIELNTLPQYKTFRMRRQMYQNMPVSLGQALVEEIQTYMPDDADYVSKIKALYKSYDLEELDAAYLAD